MSTQVTYKGSTIVNFTNDTKTLKTAGKYMEDDVTITEVIAGQGNVWQDEDGYVHLDDESGLDFQAKSVNPTESSQTVRPDAGYTALSQVTIGAISSTYVGTGIARKSSTDLTASGSTVTAPAGYYSTQATKNISGGQAFTPAVTITTNPTFSLVSSTGKLTAAYTGSSNITPTVTAGYIAAGTSGKITTTGTNTYTLTTQAATTYNVSTTDQTITSYRWLTGAQTIKGVTTENILASNIKSGVTVKVGDANNASRITQVTGTLVEGADVPVFETVWSSDYSSTTTTCNKTFAECLAYINNGGGGALEYETVLGDSWVQKYGLSVKNYSSQSITFVRLVDSRPDADIVYSSNGNISFVQPSAYLVDETITQNGYYPGPSNGGVFGAITVNVSNKYTATIRSGSTGNVNNCYVRLNNGTKYYTAGDTFEFSEGDSLYCYGSPAYSPSGNLDFIISVNAVTVARYTSPSAASYSYTMPAKDIEISMTYSAQGKISIVESVIPLNYMAGTTVTPSSTTKTLTTSSKYLTSNITINGEANLVPSNIASGVSIFGVTGTYRGNPFYDYILGTMEIKPSIMSSYMSSIISITTPMFIDKEFATGSYYFSETTNISQSAFARSPAFEYTLFSADFYFSKLSEVPASCFLNAQWIRSVYLDVCTSINLNAFYSCSKLQTVDAPNCVYINNYAFRSCTFLNTINFPACAIIGASAFNGCTALTTASFPSCTTIDSGAFYGCTRITTISFPLCRYIGASAFYLCKSLTEANLPSCSKIGSWAFSGCSLLTTVSLPLCETTGSCAFMYCSALTAISLPKLSDIQPSAFFSCRALQTVDAPLCSSISNSAFYCCAALTTASFPNCLLIGGYAFTYCTSLSIISFPLCTSVYAYAFQYCSSLATAIFPSTVTFYGYAFGSCYHLLSFYLLGSSVCLLSNTNAFFSTPISNNTTSTGGIYGSIFVPSSLYDSYKVATNWSTYAARFASLTDAQINNVLMYGRHDP